MHSSLRTHTILVDEALGSFVLWSLDSIVADLASHQGVVKGYKKAVQQSSSKHLTTTN